MNQAVLVDELEEDLFQKLKEECGVFGVFCQPDAAQTTYYGLHALQHRGQEGAGIAVSDGIHLRCKKGKGLLTELFPDGDFSSLLGQNSVGHVRYGTAGGEEIENVQPLVARAQIGNIAVVHNGQIVNAQMLRRELEERGNIFFGSSDSEIILHLIQGEKGSLLEKIIKASRRMEGAFSYLVLTEKNLYAVRDKNGLRPLSFGRRGEGYCFSSETCAFDLTDTEYIRDVKPGEIIKISQNGIKSYFYAEDCRMRLCAMEYVYFSRPDSSVGGQSVHTVRKKTGEMLAKKDQGVLSADIVVGVPDSSLSAAMGYSEQAGLPYEMGLIKNRYVGRTFIKPTQQQRQMAVKLKLSANRPVVQGKRIVLVDDSIVRGTTSKRIVSLLREAGAQEIHVRIVSPAIRYPCFYGVDTSRKEELISAKLSETELCQWLGADSLHFLSLEELKEVYGSDQFCFACFDGNYVTKLATPFSRHFPSGE